MAVGFVLINTAPAKEHEVYETLRAMDTVVEVHPLFGEYDLIAKIEAADYNRLGGIVVNTMRTIPGITNTKTLTGTKL
jgi:DNA-binding Lrp family transcriptional regulator